MTDNYPDGLSESTPGAPWNQPDPEPLRLQCSTCQHEPGEHDGFEAGQTCMYEHDKHEPCTGTYREVEYD